MTTNELRAAPGGDVIVYESPGGEVRVDVRFEDESVWLTQRQMADVFQSTPQNILMHLRNVFSSKELDAGATSKDFLIVRSEGQRKVRRNIRHYNLDAKGEASPLFGNPRGDALEAILGNIQQTMFGEQLYRSREEKAANLLYFVVKDHPFTDGNKRIGALLFLLYMTREGFEGRPDPGALTALTLLIAESAPSNKDLMVRLIVNLIGEFGN